MDTPELHIDPDTIPADCKQQPNESSLQYSAFVQYLVLGRERSVAKVTRALGKKDTKRHEQWCSVFEWVRRSKLYDQWVADHLLTLHAKTEIEEMYTRHANQSRAWLMLLTKTEEEFAARLADNPKIWNKVPITHQYELIIRAGGILPRLQEAEALARGASYKKRDEAKPKEQTPEKQTVRLIPPVVVDPKKNDKGKQP